jgi:hypothetical protein
MGAVFNYETYSGDLSTKEMKEAFEADVEQCQWENGHSYSGGIGMLRYVDTVKHITFDSFEEAEEYVDEKQNKWDGAMAVRYKEDGKEFWFVGGSCSS